MSFALYVECVIMLCFAIAMIYCNRKFYKDADNEDE
jgi:hypothetical protein